MTSASREIPDGDASDLRALRRRWAWMYEIPAPVGPRGWLMAWRHTGKGRHLIAADVAGLAAAIEADARIPSPRPAVHVPAAAAA
jgi:hypothetical protein